MATELTVIDRLIESTRAKKSILCAGFDPRLPLIPAPIREWATENYGNTYEAVGQAFARFNCEGIDAVAAFVPAVKFQSGFYEPFGHWGIWALQESIRYARSKGLIVVGDAKRGDGEDTAESYAQTYLGEIPFWGQNGATFGVVESPLNLDALTVQPYIGSACIKPFIAEAREHGRSIFVVCKTSYRPNSEVEQLLIHRDVRVWHAVAEMVFEWGKETEGIHGYRNVGVVMGATYPQDAAIMRRILPNGYFLVPGYGGQGATADDAVVGFNPDGLGGIVNSSRAIAFAYCYRDKRFQGPSEQSAQCSAKAAEFARDELNAALARAGKLNF